MSRTEKMKSENKRIGILTGPTATGKSQIALEFAEKLGNVEIINADSLLVYRLMNIGTAKPSTEELRRVPHHLVDILNPNEPFTAGEFSRAARSAIEKIESKGKRALIVGGTGFYLKALLFGIWDAPATQPEIRKRLEGVSNPDLYSQVHQIDPRAAEKIGRADRYRLIRTIEIFETSGKTPTELEEQSPTEPDPAFELWILDRPTEELHRRIHQRTQQMLSQGLVQEYEEIVRLFPECRALKAIGYAQVSAYLKNERPAGRKPPIGMAGLQSEIELATRQLVKAQRTWFNGFCKKGVHSKRFVLDQDKSLLDLELERMYGESHE
ncbi:MAG: tRNA (adenosine(37)-N6)-dimethylallyltransferase MiaA [Bdellovibrio sp.]|nr:tRNA (adenosine(37)-N6)-dimethylallyltransferase MiaA [Bdellovibrio sp.]